MLVLHGHVGDLTAPVRALCSAVDHLVVIDNNETAIDGLAQQLRGDTVTVLHHGNRGGLAGAYNRALEALRTRPGATSACVVFVDQDSDAGTLSTFLADPTVAALLAKADVAAVSPAYCDRATGLRGRYIELGRWRAHHLPRRFAGARPVAFVINSMSVWRSDALRRIGPFNESLAIDHVDTEYCLRARQLHLSVWVHGDHEFAHAIGQRRRYRLLGRELQAGGHAPQRRRLIGRNSMLLARTWCLREPGFAGLCLMRLAYEAVGIVMAEDRKLAKLSALALGIGQGLFAAARR